MAFLPDLGVNPRDCSCGDLQGIFVLLMDFLGTG